MCRTAGHLRFAGSVVGLALLLAGSGYAFAQVPLRGFVTGDAARAYEKWEAAMQAILERDDERAEDAFGELLAMDPSPLRVALLADYTVNQTAAGGAVLLFEQDLEAGALDRNGERVAELLLTGREQKNQADDGFYFSQLGRFDVANANFAALLAADPDPVALLEFTDRVPKRREILLQLMHEPAIGASVRQVLMLLDEGEEAIKADPTRVRTNIERLGGPPRGFENAVEALKESGEYAVPFMIQTLRDPDMKPLYPAILRALPQIDRPALNPLVMALRMNDEGTKRHVIAALGKIGYHQAAPYLLALLTDEDTSEDIRRLARESLAMLPAVDPESTSAAAAFFELAEAYYADTPSLAADKRLETANVWYWRDGLLQNIKVPTVIFNEIMAMRCCEETLRHEPGHGPALALWLAANFRREAQLPVGAEDHTRPDNYPPASYFAQSAGAEYCLMALARAIDTTDPAVALGMIDALRKTAGPASLLTGEGERLPLAEALSFPDRMVRVRAGLTLGAARPTATFHNYQNLMPVLSEALMLHDGARNALVVDPDDGSANTVAGALRADGFEVLTDASLFAGLQKVREGWPGVDVIFLASDVREPDLATGIAALQSEFRFAGTPVVVITKPGTVEAVQALVQADHRVHDVPLRPTPAQVSRAVAEGLRSVGAEAITPAVGAELAMDAAEVLRLLAVTRNPVFDVVNAETALLEALTNDDQALRLKVAEVLGYLGTTRAQEAVAAIALDSGETEDTRVKMFAALADAAKRRGSLLGDEMVNEIVEMAESHENMRLREAASQALGALSVPGAPASEIIRNQYSG